METIGTMKAKFYAACVANRVAQRDLMAMDGASAATVMREAMIAAHQATVIFGDMLARRLEDHEQCVEAYLTEDP